MFKKLSLIKLLWVAFFFSTKQNQKKKAKRKSKTNPTRFLGKTDNKLKEKNKANYQCIITWDLTPNLLHLSFLAILYGKILIL